MGCDIHLWFEKKNGDGKWERINIPDNLIPDDRNYEVFAFLADVRNRFPNPITPQFCDRHKPTDTECDGSDYDDNFWLGDHSFTHAYIQEILKAPWEQYSLQDCYFIIFCKYILPRLSHRRGWFTDEEEKNIRVIMGFDN